MSNIGDSVGNMAAETQQILQGISGMKIDLTDTDGTEPDMDTVNWYRERFEMFRADGVMDAINGYLNKLSKDSCNKITKAYVMKAALEIMSGE